MKFCNKEFRVFLKVNLWCYFSRWLIPIISGQGNSHLMQMLFCFHHHVPYNNNNNNNNSMMAQEKLKSE